jgi:hypothetical protein
VPRAESRYQLQESTCCLHMVRRCTRWKCTQ